MKTSLISLRALLGLLLWSVFWSPAEAVGGVVAANYPAATTVPVTAGSYTATGNTLDFTLNFTPTVGTNLTVVNHTGLGFIDGVFDNLTQGQVVKLTYGGISYRFVANY